MSIEIIFQLLLKNVKILEVAGEKEMRVTEYSYRILTSYRKNKVHLGTLVFKMDESLTPSQKSVGGLWQHIVLDESSSKDRRKKEICWFEVAKV